MIPFIVPLGLFLLLALLRSSKKLARRYALADAAAWSLAALLLLTGSAHFSQSMRPDLVRMVPPAFPRPELLVTVTGVLELMGAAGLLRRRTRPLAGAALALLFVALLPANVYAAREGLTLGGKPVTPLWRRVPEQLLYIALALWPAWSARRARARRRDGGGEAAAPRRLARQEG